MRPTRTGGQAILEEEVLRGSGVLEASLVTHAAGRLWYSSSPTRESLLHGYCTLPNLVT